MNRSQFFKQTTSIGEYKRLALSMTSGGRLRRIEASTLYYAEVETI
jgi:hypothetical protein